jgi:catalase-peroxidase
LTTIKNKFNKLSSRQVSLADLIVLSRNAAIEKAAAATGYKGVSVLFTLRRVDTT